MILMFVELLCITDFSVNTTGNKYQLLPTSPACYEDNKVLEDAKKKLLNWMTNNGKTAADFVNEELENPDSNINQIDEDWRKAFVMYGCYERIIRQNRSGLVNFADDGNITILWNTRLGTDGNVNLKMHILGKLLVKNKIDYEWQDKNTILEILLDKELKFSKLEDVTLWVYLNEETQDWEYVFEAEKKEGIPDGFEKVDRPEGFTDDLRTYNFYRKIGKDKLVVDKSYSYINSCKKAFNEIINMLNRG